MRFFENIFHDYWYSSNACHSFSELKSISNVLRTITCQDRLSSLGMSAAVTILAKNTDLDGVDK